MVQKTFSCGIMLTLVCGARFSLRYRHLNAMKNVALLLLFVHTPSKYVAHWAWVIDPLLIF